MCSELVRLDSYLKALANLYDSQLGVLLNYYRGEMIATDQFRIQSNQAMNSRIINLGYVSMSLVLCCNQVHMVIHSHILYCMDLHLSRIRCLSDTDMWSIRKKINRRGIGGCFRYRYAPDTDARIGIGRIRIRGYGNFLENMIRGYVLLFF